MIRKNKSRKVTREQLSEFWNYSVHPITGQRVDKSESTGARENSLKEKGLRKKFDRE